MSNTQDNLIAAAIGGFFILGVFGWIHNIFLIAEADSVSGMVLLRCFGILFVPLGAILGYV